MALCVIKHVMICVGLHTDEMLVLSDTCAISSLTKIVAHVCIRINNLIINVRVVIGLSADNAITPFIRAERVAEEPRKIRLFL